MAIDALLVLSFGGPNGPEDVMPFLRNVTTGRNVPDERLAEVAEQYALFGGRSPINDQNLALIQEVTKELAAHNIDLPVYFGNRNWEPFVGDTVAQMAADGVKSALVFATSAFGSYSGCRQYRQDLAGALEQFQDNPDDAPRLQKLRLFYNHPGFIEAVTERVTEVMELGQRLIFTAHSIPNSMAAACDYESQLHEAAALVARGLGVDEFDLVYQSRSGPPHIPWLEPDICDHLRSLGAGANVCVVPLGFVSDHTEVLFDLDTQAQEVAAEIGIKMTRAKTVGTHQRFVAMVRELVEEQLNADAPRLHLGTNGPWPDECPEGHCIPATSGRPQAS